MEASRRIPAPPARVYGVIADFEEGHPAILPPRHFRHFTVESGGRGAGTVMRFEMHLGGVSRRVRSVVAEPEPGRVLTETDSEHDTITTFVVDPIEQGEASMVTISTDLPSRRGLGGVIERRLITMLLRGVYAKELTRLTRYAGERL